VNIILEPDYLLFYCLVWFPVPLEDEEDEDECEDGCCVVVLEVSLSSEDVQVLHILEVYRPEFRGQYKDEVRAKVRAGKYKVSEKPTT
jgi:hypothetical protein